MSVSGVTTGSVVVAAFRQARAADARGATSESHGTGPAVGGGGDTDPSTPAIKALREQLAQAQRELQRLVDARADQQAVQVAQRRVSACAAALAAAVTQQADIQRKAAGAAGERYL